MHQAVEDSNLNLIRLLISYGADIHAEDWGGSTPLSRVIDPAVMVEMILLTRRPLLLFFNAVSVSEDLSISRSLRRVAEIPDLVRGVVMFE